MRIRKTETFIKWLKRLKDRTGKVLIAERISRLKDGNFRDCDSVGDSIYEMRIHYGPGYKVYFKDTGNEIILLLCGGDKFTQKADIIKAKEIAKLQLEDYEEE
jgi:putative addiction module killer protein